MMRVIAGKYKRLQLKAVPGNGTRPTTDKNKESLFNMIGPYFDGGCCLDLFGGTGGLGIEAISRGMSTLYTFDTSYQAIQTIRQNFSTVHLEDGYVYKMHCFKALNFLKEKHLSFDLVLLDPPYNKGFGPKVLNQLQANQLLNDGCIVVLEEASEVVIEDHYQDLERYKQVAYGATTLHLFTYTKEGRE